MTAERLYQVLQVAAFRIKRSTGLTQKAPLGRVFKPGDPPQPPLKRGENLLKVPLFKGDLGGSESDWEGEKTRPSPPNLGGTGFIANPLV